MTPPRPRRRAVINPHAYNAAIARNRRVALDRARQPVLTYYIVPRALLEKWTERRTPWLDIISEADATGCRNIRAQKEQMPDAPAGYAVIYQLQGGLGVGRQNW